MWSVVTESPKMPRGRGVCNVRQRAGLSVEAAEEGRVLDVGGVFIPLEDGTGGGVDGGPPRVLVRRDGVKLPVGLRVAGFGDGFRNFRGAGPDVLQEYRLAVFVRTQGFLLEVNVHAARQRESDDQRRRHQEVGFDGGMDARLKVAVAGQHGGADDVVFLHGLFQFRVQGAGVADAGGAAVADGFKAEGVQGGLESVRGEVVGSDAGTRSDGCFYVGGDRKPQFHGFLGQSPAASIRPGLEVLVQEVMAAMRMLPSFSSAS